MAKLEDQVTPAELLTIIRTGTTKKEVLKQFRTSEQELAMMLLPLYRARDLTMEEFNDFFKGVALKPKAAAEGHLEPLAPRDQDEPPSEILRSLSEQAAAKAPEEPKKPEASAPQERQEKAVVPEKPQPVSKAAPETAEPVAEPVVETAPEVEAEELLEEAELLEEFVEEPDIEAEAVIQAGEERETPVPEPPSEPLAEAAEKEAVIPRRKGVKSSSPEPAATEALEFRTALETIIAKLSSIDHRLAKIERHLKKP
jgi:hypothetical protein